MTVAAEDHARAAYDIFAPAYDTFTAHHDHERWTELVLDMALDAGLGGRNLLEVGCGTGSAMLPMLARGYEVCGADISPTMVARAHDKVAGRAEVTVGDMRRLPVLGHFDLVWALCDSVNYLLTDDELLAAFRGMRRNLAPEGVVAFDVSSLATLRSFYSSITVVPDATDVVVFRGRATGDLPAGGTVEAWIEHLRRDESASSWSSAVSVHRQRHHEESALRAALRAAGLRTVEVWGTDTEGGRHAPFDELRHHKAVYIARACASGGEGR